MAVIRYIASLCENPAGMASFYHRFLQMEEIGRSTEGDITITDGFYNLTLFKKRGSLNEPRMELGLNHIGLEVDSLEEVKYRYLRFRPRGTIVVEGEDLHHGQLRIHDPDGNPVTISEKGYGVTKEQRLPRIRHVAYNTHDPEGMLEFYGQVLGLREVTTSYSYRQEGKLNRFAGDGFTNLAIHPFYNARSPGHEMRFGINHIGFLVNDLKGIMAELSSALSIKPRPSNRPFAEFRFQDPEGNRLDLSQTNGYEVDVNKWERIAA